MESLPANHILEFKPDQIKSIRKQYNLDKPGDMSRAIDVLESWIKVQNHFTKKDFPRNYLEKAIIVSKGSIERAKNKLDKICTFRTAMPKFFGEHLMKNIFEDAYIFQSIILPKQTIENYRVYILKAIGSVFTYDQLINYYRSIVMTCEYFMAYDYNDGIVVVIDYTEVNLIELIKSLTLAELREIFIIITEGFGMRIKGINIVTSSKAVFTFVAIFKQLISPKLAKRICIHKKISTLYQYVPRDILPLEYGGKVKSVTELYDDMKAEFSGNDFRSYLKEMNNAKTDESCRQTDTFNEQYLGMPGSFRTLNVD